MIIGVAFKIIDGLTMLPLLARIEARRVSVQKIHFYEAPIHRSLRHRVGLAASLLSDMVLAAHRPQRPAINLQKVSAASH